VFGFKRASSQFKGVTWNKLYNKWRAKSKDKLLGYHAMEEEAAKAVVDYAQHGTVPVSKRGSSQYKGVKWNKSINKWGAKAKGLHLGHHATQKEAAQAVDDYVKHGIVPESKTVSSHFKGVSWSQSNKKWQAQTKGKHLGCHATEEEAARAIDDYTKHGTVPVSMTGSSQFRGVFWDKSHNTWVAQSKGRYLGVHATEEEAARAVDDYAKCGTVPESKKGSSQFKGVIWDKRNQKWNAKCQRKYLGLHAEEEDAARAYNVEAARLGLPLNIIPPARAAGTGAVGGGGGGGGAGPGAGAPPGRKRAAPKAPAAAQKNKKIKHAV
jgi:hypothetical protein